MVSQSHTLYGSYLSWEKSWRDRLSWEADIRAEGFAEGYAVGYAEGYAEGRREMLEELLAKGAISRSTYEASLLMQKEVIPPKRYSCGSRSSLL